jgi:hypothetical protein
MIQDVHPGSRILIFYPSWIPDPRVKKTPDPGSGYATQVVVGTDLGKHIFRVFAGRKCRRACYKNICIVAQNVAR